MTTISFIKYKKNKYWAFKQMGEGYNFFKNVKGLLFFKFLGTGSGDGFSLFPDFSVYAILCVWESEYYFKKFFKKSYYSKIISEKAFSRKDYFLNTIKSHGKWDGKNPFKGEGKVLNPHNKIGIITRANLNKIKLLEFWFSVPRASKAIKEAKGVEWFKGIGEWPLIQQATFSVWDNMESVKNFAYQKGIHKEIVKKTRSRNWYNEDLFARFEILNESHQIYKY
tara:strand:+ start:847 stop:1518 length:672 start_codon:yes stop_codon:yes gene_type:complete